MAASGWAVQRKRNASPSVGRKCTTVAYKLQSSFRRPGGLPFRPSAAAPRLVFLNWVVFCTSVRGSRTTRDVRWPLSRASRGPWAVGGGVLAGGLITPYRAVGVIGRSPSDRGTIKRRAAKGTCVERRISRTAASRIYTYVYVFVPPCRLSASPAAERRKRVISPAAGATGSPLIARR